MVDYDPHFPIRWPFGVLKTAQWVLSLALMIVIENTKWFNGGVRVISFAAWTTFLNELPNWLCHVFSVQKAVWPVGPLLAQIIYCYVDSNEE
jgi:hypothetical protein